MAQLLSQPISKVLVKKVLGKKVAKPEMSQQEKNLLKNIYLEDVIHLQKICGKEMPWSWVK